jgi:hypothetical protein
MTIEKRQPARFINIRRRFQALTSQERVLATKLQKLILVTIFRARTVELDEEREKSSALAHLALRKYCTILYFEDDGIPRPIRLDRTIASFSASQCWNFFETRQEDLIRLLHVLRLPELCTLTNGSTMAGEEVMLRGLYELVSGEDQYNIAENVFGREQSQQSRAFYFFIDHVFTTFYDLVTDNLQWWWDEGFFHASRDAITRRLRSIGWTGENTVGWFIDCNCMETARVAGGPRTGGPNARRWVCNIQKAFYNGWKSNHGLKHQTVDLAHGFTIDMYGPTSLRRNDLRLFGLSHINARMVWALLPLGRIPRTHDPCVAEDHCAVWR